ncbi:hypothetical protein GCM10027299_52530 [Larkinella ripae]
MEQPMIDTYFEMQFESPLAGQIHLMRSELLEIEPTLDVISKMATKEVILLYLQRLAINPVRPIVSAEIMIEARQAHVLIHNFVENLTLTINEKKEWVVNFTFKEFIDGFENVEEGRDFIPPSLEEGHRVFRFYKTLIKSHFYNREAVGKAVEFFFLIHSPQIQKILEDQKKGVETKQRKAPKKKYKSTDVVKLTPPAKFRRPSIFIENSQRKAQKKQVVLKHKVNPLQLPIFLSIKQDELEGIDENWFNDRLNQRITLSATEHKLVISISQVLQEVSRNTENPDKEDYYTGNADPNKEFENKTENVDQRFVTRIQEDGRLVDQRTATISFPLYKLTQVYIGRARKANTAEKDFVLKLAMSFQTDFRKMILVPTNASGGGIDYEFEPIMKVVLRTSIGQKPYLVLKLHPVFIDQIDRKFAEYPYGYLDKIYEANGGNQRLSDVVLPFLDYLAHLRANRNNSNYNPTIYIPNLYYLLAKHWVEDPQRGLKFVKKKVDEAIRIAVDVGLLNHLPTEIEGKTGELMYRWDINSNWC